MSSYVSRSKGVLEETDQIGEEKTLTTGFTVWKLYVFVLILKVSQLFFIFTIHHNYFFHWSYVQVTLTDRVF